MALFVYARPEHTRRTLAALAANDGASETELIVYADGPRRAQDHERIEATRRVAREARGFRSVEVVERPSNLGLARNITLGVGEVMARAGRAIVLEDDVETARGFLDYMNAALDRYEHEPRVWHISGWNYPIEPADLPPFFFWRVMNCWGWASWADRWRHYRRDPRRLAETWSPEQRRAFNLEGAHDFFSQILDNKEGRIETWAAFWYATIFENEGLCLNPAQSFTRNIGLDGSGEHCGPVAEQSLEIGRHFEGGLPDQIESSWEAVTRVVQYLELPLHRRVGRYMSRALHRILPT